MAREMAEEYVKQRMSGFSKAYTTVHSQLCCIATTKLVDYSQSFTADFCKPLS
jgi:hypothetical protein